MEPTSDLYDFLIKDLGFTKIEEKYDFANFGNYIITFSSESFLLRYISDRSVVSIDVKSKSKSSKWYDLALVKALVNEEKILNIPSDVKLLNEFLRNHNDLISELFNSSNHSGTEIKLENLLDLRYKQMFPPG